jgi:double zinc ribbon protein
MKFCGQCTAPLALTCPKCHSHNPPGFKFCGQCTAALDPANTIPGQPRPSITLRDSDDAAAMDGERKTVTALFADIKGSMELMGTSIPRRSERSLTLVPTQNLNPDVLMVQPAKDRNWRDVADRQSTAEVRRILIQ